MKGDEPSGKKPLGRSSNMWEDIIAIELRERGTR
jgi:hypothetical protein